MFSKGGGAFLLNYTNLLETFSPLFNLLHNPKHGFVVEVGGEADEPHMVIDKSLFNWILKDNTRCIEPISLGNSLSALGIAQIGSTFVLLVPRN